jgi:RAB6A-GEF complex partner protein 2
MLEAHESLPTAIASAGNAFHQPRRVHAEHHAAFVQSALRTSFALDIPSDASPSFQVEISDPSIESGA